MINRIAEMLQVHAFLQHRGRHEHVGEERRVEALEHRLVRIVGVVRHDGLCIAEIIPILVDQIAPIMDVEHLAVYSREMQYALLRLLIKMPMLKRFPYLFNPRSVYNHRAAVASGRNFHIERIELNETFGSEQRSFLHKRAQGFALIGIEGGVCLHHRLFALGRKRWVVLQYFPKDREEGIDAFHR